MTEILIVDDELYVAAFNLSGELVGCFDEHCRCELCSECGYGCTKKDVILAPPEIMNRRTQADVSGSSSIPKTLERLMIISKAFQPGDDYRLAWIENFFGVPIDRYSDLSSMAGRLRRVAELLTEVTNSETAKLPKSGPSKSGPSLPEEFERAHTVRSTIGAVFRGAEQ